MKLIVISSSSSIENEAHIITKLFEAGLETFHIRKPRNSTNSAINLLKSIPAVYHNRIVIHSHHKLAYKFNLKGIHLTKTHLKRKFKTWMNIKIIKFKNPSIQISTSFNNIGQVLDENQSYDYDYVFLSPIFDSLNSKFQGGYTEHTLITAIENSKIKVVARGGIDITVIEKANQMGFEGLAFYSSIWKKKDPLLEFYKLIERFKELKIKIE
jgi:thiamine-phosphate pyrophosphorylase